VEGRRRCRSRPGGTPETLANAGPLLWELPVFFMTFVGVRYFSQSSCNPFVIVSLFSFLAYLFFWHSNCNSCWALDAEDIDAPVLLWNAPIDRSVAMSLLYCRPDGREYICHFGWCFICFLMCFYGHIVYTIEHDVCRYYYICIWR
jgi:hypothetical protein